MTAELVGVVPNIPPDYAKTIVQRSFSDIQRKNLWSFLVFESNWTSPGIVNAGNVNVTQGNNQAVFNATAANAVGNIGLIPSSVTQRQFRVGVGTIYNIWAWDGNNTATLDRPYQEPTANNSSYQIYQCYYVSPVSDFWQWLTIRDMVNWNDLIVNKPRSFIDLKDPQRTIYYIPTHCVPYQTDRNPASQTFGYPMFELWGQPNFVLPYQLYGLRKSWTFSAAGDNLPPQIGEDCVMSLSRYYAYQWAEANWKKEWGPKPNFAFLMKEEVSNNRRGQGTGLFNRLYGEYRMQDRATMDNYRALLRRVWSFPSLDGSYSSIAGVASPGSPW